MIFNLPTKTPRLFYRGEKTVSLFHFDDPSNPYTPTKGIGRFVTGSYIYDGKFNGGLFWTNHNLYYEDDNLKLKGSPFTIEYFFKGGGTQCVLGGEHTSSYILVTLISSGDQLVLSVSGHDPIYVNNLSTNPGTYSHIAVVGDGGTQNNRSVSVFLNGIKICTKSGTNYDLDYRILALRSTYYIDEFRFSNVARYAANFTPTTVPFAPD